MPEWAGPYVAACYTNGITRGYDAKTYGGSDTVTTGQAALMLLKALGYFQYSADFGSDWLVETTKNGSTAGLFDGVATGAKEALTRNDVAQMVLNALEADLVKAEKNGSDVHVGDVVISGGKATYDARTGTDSKVRQDRQHQGGRQSTPSSWARICTTATWSRPTVRMATSAVLP